MIYNKKPVLRDKYYNDGVEDHLKIMYDHIAEQSNGNPEKGYYNYPSILQTINFVRNAFNHPDMKKPNDYRTGLRSFGNIFTFSSMLIISFYACVETLNKWQEVIETK